MAHNRGYKLGELNQKAEQLRALPLSIQHCTIRIAEHQQNITNLQAPITKAGEENKHAADEAKNIVKPSIGTRIWAIVSADSRKKIAAINANNQRLMTAKEKKGETVNNLAQQVSGEQKEIKAKTDERNQFEEELAELESISLVAKPANCRDSFIQKLTTFRQHYEKHHPARQSNYVRLCLANMQDKIEQMTGNLGEIKDADAHARQQYFQLRGMITTMLQSQELQYEKNHSDQAFQDELMQALREFDVTIDEINTQESIEQYRAYTKGHHEMDLNILQMRENGEFNAVRDELQQIVDNMAAAIKTSKFVDSDFINLHKHSANLLNTFTHMNQDYERGSSPDFDRKFRTAILRTSVELIRGQKDLQSSITTKASTDAYEQYQIYLAQEKKGRSSIGKKAWGVMFMFLGAVMIGVSIAAKIVTMGLSTPASTWTLLGGIGVFGSGAALFRAGMQKGPSLSIAKVAKRTQDSQVRYKLDKLGILNTKNVVAKYAWTGSQPSAPSEEKPPAYDEVALTDMRQPLLTGTNVR